METYVNSFAGKYMLASPAAGIKVVKHVSRKYTLWNFQVADFYKSFARADCQEVDTPNIPSIKSLIFFENSAAPAADNRIVKHVPRKSALWNYHKCGRFFIPVLLGQIVRKCSVWYVLMNLKNSAAPAASTRSTASITKATSTSPSPSALSAFAAVIPSASGVLPNPFGGAEPEWIPSS